MNTSSIITAIHSDFSTTYKYASNFVGSGELWDFCLATIKDARSMSCIVFANDLGIPPVQSLLVFYRRAMCPQTGFEFTGKQSQDMGYLMGFVFKFVLGYTDQYERCKVGDLGVKTATKFLNGPVIEFVD